MRGSETWASSWANVAASGQQGSPYVQRHPEAPANPPPPKTKTDRTVKLCKITSDRIQVVSPRQTQREGKIAEPFLQKPWWDSVSFLGAYYICGFQWIPSLPGRPAAEQARSKQIWFSNIVVISSRQSARTYTQYYKSRTVCIL